GLVPARARAGARGQAAARAARGGGGGSGITFTFGGALADAESPRTEDHLVSLSAVQARLGQSCAQRDADLAELRSALASPEASAAVARVGLDGRALSEQAAILSDEELQDLAQRAIFLRSDPTAGSVAK